MHLVKQIRLYFIAILLIVVTFLLPVLYGAQSADHQSRDGSLRLQSPPFIEIAKAQGVNFDGAGIAAYFKVSRTIDLKKVKAVMRSVDDETEQYIVGAIAIPDYGESWDAKVYANVDGWVIVYYDRTQPASILVDWLHYSYGTEPQTTLEQALIKIANEQSITTPAPSFYHFDFPDATDIMVVLDVCTIDTDCPDLFEITLPDSFQYSETSWSLASKGAFNDFAKLFIDDNSLPHGVVSAVGSVWDIDRGKIFPILSSGFKHSFHIRSHYDSSGHPAAGAIIIVYNKGLDEHANHALLDAFCPRCPAL